MTSSMDVSHIQYHLILRQCSRTQYAERSRQHTDLGAYFVASFFEQSDSETPTDHFHCLVRLPACKKTYEDRFRKKYSERNLQVLKQIKPFVLDPTHLENTLLYISKDGQLVHDDLSIDWMKYSQKRALPPKSAKSKPNFNEFLAEEFSVELKNSPQLYYKRFSDGDPTFIERNTIKFIRKYLSGKYRDFDEMILIKKYHLLNHMFSLEGVDVVDLALSRLFK